MGKLLDRCIPSTYPPTAGGTLELFSSRLVRELCPRMVREVGRRATQWRRARDLERARPPLMDPRFVRWLVWSTAALPLAWLGLFWLYVLRARLALGAWPQPYRPDPKDLGFDLHHVLIALLLPLPFVTPLVLASWTVLGRGWLRAAHVRPWLALSVGLALSAGVFALARLDPGRFVEWYCD